jgi:hypothetical protein
MYISVRGIPHAGQPGGTPDGGSPAVPSGGPARQVSRVVVLLGAVSLLTDLSSEMVVAVLPVFLTAGLGLTAVQYGVVDGLYRGVTAAVRIGGGMAADLTRRPKLVATLGYGLSCVCKLFLLPVQGFAGVSAVLSADRIGKGIRTAPRDAMIAQATPVGSLGYAFGVHRAMDAVGALGGPLIAFGVLAALPNGFDAIFVLSFGIAAVGVAALVLFVPDVRPEPAATTTPALTAEATADPPARRGAALRRAGRDALALARGGAYRRVLVVAGVLSVATVTDGFVYLALRDRVGVSATLFPLLFVGTSTAYLLLAVPMGVIADRLGRGRVFLAGHVAAVGAYLSLWLLPPGPWVVAAVLALVGTYYAATDGVLAALTSTLVPVGARGTGLAGVQTVVALGGLASAVVFGVLWSRFGPQQAVVCFAAALAVGVALAALLLPGVRPGGGGPASDEVTA